MLITDELFLSRCPGKAKLRNLTMTKAENILKKVRWIILFTQVSDFATLQLWKLTCIADFLKLCIICVLVKP